MNTPPPPHIQIKEEKDAHPPDALSEFPEVDVRFVRPSWLEFLFSGVATLVFSAVAIMLLRHYCGTSYWLSGVLLVPTMFLLSVETGFRRRRIINILEEATTLLKRVGK